MYSNYQKGPQGDQNDRYSGSKFTNQTRFQPFYSATEKIYSKYKQRIKNRNYPYIRIEPTHDDFIFPVTVSDIRETLKLVPRIYLEGIKAILVPPGSKKQIKAANSLYIYGEYWQKCLFLHPYPNTMLTIQSTNKFKPHEFEDYKRTGAEISERDNVKVIIFNDSSLRRFYLCDVLMHEIGHHIDKQRRSQRKREKFAEWFALRYGYKLNR